MSLEDVKGHIRQMMSVQSEINSRIAQSSNISKATINSVSDDYRTCNITLVKAKITLDNVPIDISENDRAEGSMPILGSTVFVEHQGTGMGAKIISICSSESDPVALARDGNGPLATAASLPSTRG